MDTKTTAVAPQLRLADTPSQIAAARDIFREYALGLGVDLCFQGFEEELAELPGDYAAPQGALWLAMVGEAVAGCCALRPLQSVEHQSACEMKRLYVRPAYRGLGLGLTLAQAVMQSARSAGYACMLLDTLEDMRSARGVYAELGFQPVAPYYHNPIAGAHYLKAWL